MSHRDGFEILCVLGDLKIFRWDVGEMIKGLLPNQALEDYRRFDLIWFQFICFKAPLHKTDTFDDYLGLKIFKAEGRLEKPAGVFLGVGDAMVAALSA